MAVAVNAGPPRQATIVPGIALWIFASSICGQAGHVDAHAHIQGGLAGR